MIVSMPQIAVNAAPVNAATGTGPSGKFSAALAEATDATQDTSASPKLKGDIGGSNRGNVATKSNTKSSTKSSGTSVNSTPGAQQPTANLPDAGSVKILDNALLPAFSSLPQSTEGETSEASSVGSSGTGKSDPAASSTGTLSEILTVPAGLAALSVPAELLGTNTGQMSRPIQEAGSEIAPPSLPVSSGSTKPFPALPTDKPVEQVSKDGKPSTIAAEQNTKSVSATAAPVVPPVAKPATVDPRPANHEDGHNAATSGTKSPVVSATVHQSAVADVAQIPVAPVQTADTKFAPLQTGQSNVSATGKTNVDSAPSVSDTTKKDEGSAQTASSQSGKNDSSAAVVVAATKQISSDGASQTSASSSPSVAGSAQISQPIADGKAAATSVFSKAADPAPKSLGQTPTVPTDAETTAETAASHLSSPFQVAKLVERAGQAELRVGLQAGEFGSVDIRTSMARSQFTAEISVERGELGRALTAELPALHNRLAEQRLPLANIILQDHSDGSGSGDLRQGARHNQYAQPIQAMGIDEAESNPAITGIETMETSAGLDIHM